MLLRGLGTGGRCGRGSLLAVRLLAGNGRKVADVLRGGGVDDEE